MAKMRGAHSLRPRVRQGPSSSAVGPSLAVAGSSAADITAVGPIAAADPSAATAGADPSAPYVRPTSAHAAAVPVGDTKDSSFVALAQSRYHTRVGPTPPTLSHSRPAQGSHLHRYPGCHPLHLIRVFPEPQTCLRGPSSGDLTFPATPSQGMLAIGIEIFMGRCIMISRHFLQTLRDSVLLIQRYHLKPFMVPRQYYYLRVVTEFYHTLTSRREANSTALYFSIDGKPRILRASDIIAALHLPVVLANDASYKKWPHPSTREMVRLLSMDATSGSVLFRRHLPQRMLLIDHILRSNMFPLHHIVHRRGDSCHSRLSFKSTIFIYT